MRNISTDISALGRRTHLKYGELFSLFIVYNITIFWLCLLHSFLFYFLLRDSAHTLYAWISKLLRDVAFTLLARELWFWVKRWPISGNSAIWTVLVLRFWVLREINSRFCSKTLWQAFLLVSGRHVGAHLNGLHTNLYKFGENVSPQIFHNKNCCDLNLRESLCISTFFPFPDSKLYLLNGFDFLHFDLFWMSWHWKPAISRPMH